MEISSSALVVSSPNILSRQTSLPFPSIPCLPPPPPPPSTTARSSRVFSASPAPAFVKPDRAKPARPPPGASAPRKHHSKSYLARQAAVLEIQQSPDLDSALERFGGVLKVQDLNAILRYFGKLNRMQDISKLFQYMQKHEKISASSYSSYIKFTGTSHNPLNALEIYNSILDASMRINVFISNAVLSCLVRNGKFGVGMKCFQQMKQDGLKPDIITYSTLLAGCMKVNDGYTKALELIQELENNGLEMDSVIYGTLIAVCASNNHCEDAERFFKKMVNEGHAPNEFHYSSLLNAYSADGNYKKADTLVRDMKSAGLVINKVILTTLLKVYVRGGLFDKSRELLAELELLGHAKDEMSYCLFMDGLAKAGRTDEAKSVFDEMMGKSVKSDGYAHCIMISAFCRCGLLQEAKLLAKDFEAKFNRYDLVILNTMLGAYCRACEMESVMQTLKKMDELAISPDYSTFHILVKYFFKERLYLLAYRTMQDMHKKGHQPEEGLCSSLIFQLGKMNAYSEAFSVYNMLRYSKRSMCKALHEKILHILISGRLYKEAYVVVKDNVGLISKQAVKKFATAFMKSEII
ncbi:pentatricopeptide repeat-containing protein At1g10910, chloroplastic isoform X2 [Rhodamnia argentea]|uniref:Pentatricopeptide repeat-containing protein At1g10910, chloroplastic isoform X2 n=1 Tax=Rhodamnia argentea TaxID=178133 RepID=A0A8B8R2P4_9MYRT|nr:pentatricopeptide repeat-containing protein At1g10910, chloroplastic isoform X2 [Rhodamnia argentea]